MRHAVRTLFPARGGKVLPLSTLLLAALCLVLTAPTAQAGAGKYSSHAAILSVLKQSEQAAPFSQLEAHQLHTILTSLDEAQLAELGHHLATLSAITPPASPSVVFSILSTPQHYVSLEPHLAAKLCGVRTNAYLE